MKAFWVSAALLVAACTEAPEKGTADNKVAADTESAPAPAGDAAPAPSEAVAKDTPAASAAQQPYTARGQEPGWALTIDKDRIDYQGNYGEKLIKVARPEPQPSANGRRYVTDRLTVVITYKGCNDAMSGHGYEHEVTVIADGETYQGCGGERRTDSDM